MKKLDQLKSALLQNNKENVKLIEEKINNRKNNI